MTARSLARSVMRAVIARARTHVEGHGPNVWLEKKKNKKPRRNLNSKITSESRLFAQRILRGKFGKFGVTLALFPSFVNRSDILIKKKKTKKKIKKRKKEI